MPGSHVSVGESKLCHRTRPLGAERIRLPESRSLRERFDEVLKVGAVLQRVVLEWVRINEPVWVKWRIEPVWVGEGWRRLATQVVLGKGREVWRIAR